MRGRQLYNQRETNN